MVLTTLSVLALLSEMGATRRGDPASVDLDAKIGKMLMVGFRGRAVDENHFIVRDIRQRNLGGVILFDYDVAKNKEVRNIESPAQVRALVASLRAASAMPCWWPSTRRGAASPG